MQIKTLNLILALGLTTTVASCDSGEKKAEDGKADAKAEDGKADAKAEDGKADAKAEDGKADAKAEDGDGDAQKEEAAAGGGDNPLVGTWELDVDAIKELDEYKNAPEEQQKQMVQMMSAMQMEMAFTEDAIKMSVAMGGKKQDKEGTYTVKSNEDGKVVIESEVDGKKEELTVAVDGDKIVMEQGGKKMAFKKKG